MKYLALTIMAICYYALAAFILYGNYYIVIQQGHSKWWLLSLLLLAGDGPSIKTTTKDA